MLPNLHFRWRWIGVIWPFLVGAAVLLALGIFSMDVLSSTRAYVNGESLWSKAQKEAVFHLYHYAASGDEADFAAYLMAVAVPLGDRKARLELEKPAPDFDIARQGFLEGRNHPEDIDGMIRLFRNFHDISFMREPIAIWTEADAHIAKLSAEAALLRAAIASGRADMRKVRGSLARVESINAAVTPLEEAFSYSLGAASRKAGALLLLATLAIAATMTMLGSVISHRILENNERFAQRVRRLTARTAAEHERKKADALLRRQAELLDKARDAISVRDLDHRITYWNKSAERLYGWRRDQALGVSIEALIDGDPLSFREASAKVIEHGEWRGELTKRRADGTELTVESRWTLVRDDADQPSAIMAVDTDISERKMAEFNIAHLAYHDPLTQLPNRVLLIDRLQQTVAISARLRRASALLFIDLDQFKAINDTLGHEQGDHLLQQTALRLRANLRDSDTLARLGGDEFVVILTELNGSMEEAAMQAKAICEKLLDVLGQPYMLDGQDQYSTASIGVTMFSQGKDEVGELMKRSDMAMYQAKAAGRNTVRFFSEHMQAAVNARAELEEDLRQGLRKGEFVLHYQPQVDSAGRIIGAEALARWCQPQRGMVSPAQFIPVMEETGTILQLGQWVLEVACAQLALWGRRVETSMLSIAVNVSARQFHQEHFVEQVQRALAAAGANACRLELELTESLLLDDVEATIDKMAQLKTTGVRFSLDDFGTGYSSLSYLKRLPLDQLKIDQSFVRDILTDANDAAIARTIVALAHSLGLEVIAEGVESQGQRAFLSENNCHLYQGYLFGRPVPIAQLDLLLLAETLP